MTIQTQALQRTLDAIEALDLAPIKFKATRTEDGYGWTAAYADRMADAYKRWLVLHAKHPDATLAPERDVDRFWHLHILDTRKYAADCDAMFGRFLHHFSYLGLRGAGDEAVLQQAYERMRALETAEFGASAQGPAWCSVEAPKQGAAWCSVEAPKQGAAWCSVEAPKQGAAWCSVEAPKRGAAWCSVEAPTAAAAWCSVEEPEAAPAHAA